MPTTKPKTVGARAYDYITDLFQRDNSEFIGWHGTNSVSPLYTLLPAS